MKTQFNMNDKRVIKTEKRIHDAYVKVATDCVAQGKSVSVTDVCEEAGINRTTFYKHFDSIDELDRRVTQGINDEFRRNLKGIEEIDNFEYLVKIIDLTKKYFNLSLYSSDFYVKNVYAQQLLAEALDVFKNSYDCTAIVESGIADLDAISKFVIGGSTVLILQSLYVDIDTDSERLAEQVNLFAKSFFEGLSNNMK